MKRTVMVLAAAIVLAAGCGSSEDASSSSNTAAATTVAGARPQAAANAQVTAVAPGNNPAVDPAVLAAQAAGLKQIYTGSMQIEVKESVFAAALEAKRIVTDAGGFVASERSVQRENDPQPTADITFKIPPERFTAVADEFARRLGTERGRQVASNDVTAQFIDLEARLKTAEISLERVRKLLTEAKTVTEVLSLEGEVAKRETQVEQYKAQLSSLSRQIDYATLTVTLAQRIAPAPDPKKDDSVPSPLEGLKAGARAFLGTLKIVLLIIAVLLPFVPFGLLAWWATRRWLIANRKRDAEPFGGQQPTITPVAPRTLNEPLTEEAMTGPSESNR